MKIRMFCFTYLWMSHLYLHGFAGPLPRFYSTQERTYFTFLRNLVKSDLAFWYRRKLQYFWRIWHHTSSPTYWPLYVKGPYRDQQCVWFYSWRSSFRPVYWESREVNEKSIRTMDSAQALWCILRHAEQSHFKSFCWNASIAHVCY